MPELSPFTLYLIFTAGDLRTLFGIASLGGMIVMLFTTIAYSIEVGKLPPRLVYKAGIPAVVVVGLLSVLTPSTKTLVAMYGIPALIEGTKTAAASEVGQKSYRAINKLLDEYLTEKK